jgi:hypothetical protein
MHKDLIPKALWGLIGNNLAARFWTTIWFKFPPRLTSFLINSQISSGCSLLVRVHMFHILCSPFPTSTDFEPGEYYPSLPSAQPVILRKKMTWIDLQQYLRTWSSLHTYHERYPEDLKRPEGDIAVRLWKSLKNGVGAKDDHDSVDIEWPLALMLVRRA